MSALRGEAGLAQAMARCPPMTRSRHQFVASRGFDRVATAIDARLRRNGGGRHNHLLATLDAARARPHDLASVVARHNIAPAFRTGISSSCEREVILRTDVGTDHVMKHWKELQRFGAASRTHGLILLNLHRLALRATPGVSSAKPEDGPARWRERRKGRCNARERRP